jgi:hypothetical protein
MGDRKRRAQGIDGAGEKPARLGELPLLGRRIVAEAHDAMGAIGKAVCPLLW